MNNKTKLLFLLDEILRKKHGIEFFLMGGTLLGAIREKDFIKHDKDIDLGIKERFWLDTEKFKLICMDLKKAKIKMNYIWNNDIFGLVKHGVMCHIIYLHRSKKEYYQYANRGKFTYPLECIDKLDEIRFLGRKFKVPHRPRKFLAHIWHKHWRIPMKEGECKYYNMEPTTWYKKQGEDIKFLYKVPLFKAIKDKKIHKVEEE